MIAAFLHGPGDIRMGELPEPVPGPGEALIRIRAVGVCASDLHFYRNGVIGGTGFDSPALLGHECAGEVVALGPARPGDPAPPPIGARVAVEPTRACGECDLCRAGRYNICRNLRFAGQPPEPGALREYMTAPLRWLYALPDNVSFAEGAMIEPIAVAVHAVRLAQVGLGASVAVLGAGAIGLSILQAARACGATPVIVSEPLNSRRVLAEQLGASAAIDPTQEDPREVVAALTHGAGVDVAFEASGGDDAPAQAASWVGNGGSLVLVGIPDEDEVSLSASVIRRREMVIRTVRRYCADFAEALQLVSSSKMDAGSFVSSRFKLEDTAHAFAAAATHPDRTVRAIVEV